MKALCIALLLALCSWSLASAQTPAQVGVVTVPVAGESEAARDAALAEAMSRFIVRRTGLADLPQTEAGERLQAQAERYLVGFTYRNVTVQSGDLTQPGPPVIEQRLEARFAVRDIERALVNADIEIWPSPRPTVLVWLAVEAEGERRIAEAGRDDDWFAALRESAEALGVRFIFPLMDLQDLSSLAYADIAAGFAGPLRNASARYGVDEILAGRLQIAADGRVSARWMQLDDERAMQRWQDSAAAMPDLLARAAERVAGELRRVYAYLPDLSAQRLLTVRVQGIDSLEAHNRVVERLQALSGIDRASPMVIDGDQVTFVLAITVDEERVLTALENDARLSAEGDDWRWR